jgi:transposase
MARVAELERQFGLNSSNSGKPPSSDGLKRPPRTSSLREKSGGQKGHKGHMLAQVETPDRVVNLYPKTCSNCGGIPNVEASVGHKKRQEALRSLGEAGSPICRTLNRSS